MKHAIVLVIAVLCSTSAGAADPPVVDGVSGAPVVWSDLIAKRGPVAVIVWASWAPGAAAVVDASGSFREASRDAGLNLLLLDIQESLEDGRKALSGSGFSWVHDRHGALLKEYRVISIPSIIVLSPDGEVLGRLDATPAALRSGAPQ